MLTKVSTIIVALVAFLVPALAFAQKPVTVHVIALDSDDASEDQADALTAAMRQRVRTAPTLQLAESNQSLATLYQKRLITLDAAMGASSMKDELEQMISRGAGVVPGAGMQRPGAPRPPLNR